MRDFKGMKRQRGRNRKPGGGNGANSANPNRSWDSQGPENIKVRGNAQTVYERYMQLARDAASAGDRVLAENYLQHAEHYFRVLRALQPARPVSEIAQRELSNQGFDIDFEDESGAQAAAFLAAQQAADRQAQQEAERAAARERGEGDQPRMDGENGDRNDRQRETRDQRDSRRDRWERRREERNKRIADGVATPEDLVERERDEYHDRRREEQRLRREAEAAGLTAEPVVETAATEAPSASDDQPPLVEDRPARRPRAPRASGIADDTASALPGFLTRSAAPAADADEAPAPKRRAPRKKAETASAED
jgi:hypothetical protein